MLARRSWLKIFVTNGISTSNFNPYNMSWISIAFSIIDLSWAEPLSCSASHTTPIIALLILILFLLLPQKPESPMKLLSRHTFKLNLALSVKDRTPCLMRSTDWTLLFVSCSSLFSQCQCYSIFIRKMELCNEHMGCWTLSLASTDVLHIHLPCGSFVSQLHQQPRFGLAWTLVTWLPFKISCPRLNNATWSCHVEQK